MGILRATSFSVAFFNVHFHLNEKTFEKGENCCERIPSNINRNMSIYVWTVFSISLVYIIQIAKRILYSLLNRRLFLYSTDVAPNHSIANGQ